MQLGANAFDDALLMISVERHSELSDSGMNKTACLSIRLFHLSLSLLLSGNFLEIQSSDQDMYCHCKLIIS